mgnify:FL=1
MWDRSDLQPTESWNDDDDDDDDDGEGNIGSHPSIHAGQHASGTHRPPLGFDTTSAGDTTNCPHCQSHRVITSHLGRRVGGAIGTLAGAMAATARVTGGAQLGAEIGALLGTSAGPAGFTVGAFSGALLGAMAGAAAGCAVGAALGEAIDAKILHNHQCIDCGRGFSLDTA